MNTPEATHLLQLTQKLLESISTKDWATYQQLTDPSLTCFEPEACGHLVEGMAFHQFYFQLGGGSRPGNVTMVQPHVRFIGDVALVCYVRLVQSVSDSGPKTTAWEETRAWQRSGTSWKLVHFHRSPAGVTNSSS